MDIVCNIALVSCAKKTTKESTAMLVKRLVEKAELLDVGTLNAMMENSGLKTVNVAVEKSFAAVSHMPQREPTQRFAKMSQVPLSPQMIMSSEARSPQELPSTPKMYHELKNPDHYRYGTLDRYDRQAQQREHAMSDDQQRAYQRQYSCCTPSSPQSPPVELPGSTRLTPKSDYVRADDPRPIHLELSDSSPAIQQALSFGKPLGIDGLFARIHQHAGWLVRKLVYVTRS